MGFFCCLAFKESFPPNPDVLVPCFWTGEKKSCMYNPGTDHDASTARESGAFVSNILASVLAGIMVVGQYVPVTGVVLEFATDSCSQGFAVLPHSMSKNNVTSIQSLEDFVHIIPNNHPYKKCISMQF